MIAPSRRIAVSTCLAAPDEWPGAPAKRGEPPFGRTSRLRVFIDPDLLPFDEVWAAAGRRHGVFGIEPTRWLEPANSW